MKDIQRMAADLGISRGFRCRMRNPGFLVGRENFMRGRAAAGTGRIVRP